MGSPRFRRATRSEAGQRAFQSPITMEGGLAGNLREMRKEDATLEAITEEINNRISSPGFSEYYKGIRRNGALEKAKTAAILSDDEASYDFADDAQLISDLIMFEKVGRGDEFIDYYKEQAEAANPAKIQDKAIRAQELREMYRSGGNPGYYDGKSDDVVLQDHYRNLNKMVDHIDTIQEASTHLRDLFGEDFNDNALEGLAYIFAMEKLVTKRHGVYKESFDKSATDILNKLPQLKTVFKVKDEDGNVEDMTINQILSSPDLVSILKSFDNKNSKKFLSTIKSQKMITNDVIDSFVKDFAKVKSAEDYRASLVEGYNFASEHPELFTKQVDQAIKKADEKAANAEVMNTVEDSSQAETYDDFVKKLEGTTESEKLRVVEQMKDNPFAQIYAKKLQDVAGMVNQNGYMQKVANLVSGNVYTALERVLKTRLENHLEEEDILRPVEASELSEEELNYLNDINNYLEHVKALKAKESNAKKSNAINSLSDDFHAANSNPIGPVLTAPPNSIEQIKNENDAINTLNNELNIDRSVDSGNEN